MKDVSQKTASAVFLLESGNGAAASGENQMGIGFWVRRFVVVFLGALVVIGAGQLLQGRSLEHALSQGLLWAFLAAGVFTAARLYQARRGRHCAICRDTPEMRD